MGIIYVLAADFKPIARQDRNFGVWDLAALWIGLVVSNTTWYLAGSLVELGGDPHSSALATCVLWL